MSHLHPLEAASQARIDRLSVTTGKPHLALRQWRDGRVYIHVHHTGPLRLTRGWVRSLVAIECAWGLIEAPDV